jgi:hypothetical protein
MKVKGGLIGVSSGEGRGKERILREGWRVGVGT